MKKSNLVVGDIVKLRNGDCFICIGKEFCLEDFYINLDEYNENLESIDGNKNLDIIEIKRPKPKEIKEFEEKVERIISKKETPNMWGNMTYAEAHKKMYMAIANNEVPSKGEWLEKTNPYPAPYYHELTNNCFACDEAKRRREKEEVELRAAKNDSGMLIYHSPESICKYCPLLGKDDEFGRCLNGLYDDFCCAKGFDKFKLAYEIANLEWR